MPITSNIIRSVRRTTEDRVSILSICRENEKYLLSLAKCNCDIYVLRQEGLSDWKDSISKRPKNIFIIGGDLNDCGISFFDFAICHGRLQEFDAAHNVSSSLHIPLITVDHVGKKTMQKLPLFSKVAPSHPLEARVGSVNVALSDRIKDSWQSSIHGISITIPNFIDKRFSGDAKKNKSFLLDNNIPQEIVAPLHPAIVKFNCQSRFEGEKINDPKDFEFYINTWNNIDSKTLEAMAAGCICLSPRTDESEAIIDHGVNGLLFSSPENLEVLMTQCINGEFSEIGDNAKRFVSDTCVDEDVFIKKWGSVLSFCSQTFHMRN